MDLTGRTLSHYLISEEISRGGMGVVYRATDTRLHRDVALKILPDDLMHDADRRRRFVQEAQAASAIEHPNVAVIYDVGEADGLTFIAMELIRGRKLGDWLATTHPPVARTLELATEIASGLARAHEKQIVHRDLKPANVMVTDDGHAKIIDFGIAKLIEPVASATDETRANAPNTGAGVVVGTMTYMSPEQARGDRVDARSDIFTFGLVFHEMLSGQPPFQGKTGLETASLILHGVAPRLPSLGVAVPADVSGDVQRMVDKCLEKDPADRYQGMRDLIVDLRAARRRLESGTQPATTVTTAVTPAPRPPQGRGLLIGAAAVVVLTLVAGLAWRFIGGRAPSAPAAPPGKPSVAVLYFDNSTAATDLAWLRTGIPEMVVTDLSQSTELSVVSSDRLYGVLSSLKRADDPTLSPDVVSQVAERTGVTQVVVGSYMKAGDAIRINARLQDVKTGRIVTSESIEGPSTASLFQMVDDLSHRLLTKVEGLTPATAAPTAVLSAPGTPSLGLDHGLGQVTTTSIEAYQLYAEGIDLHERFREPQAGERFQKAIALDPTFAMALAKLAVVESNLGHSDLMEKYARQALDHADRLPPRDRYYIEGFYYEQHRASLGRGMDAYRKCIEVDPTVQSCRQNLGIEYLSAERFDEAVAQYDEIIRRGGTNPGTYHQLARAYIAQGEVDRALTLVQGYEAQHPESGLAAEAVAETLLYSGRLVEARPFAEHAVRLAPDLFEAVTVHGYVALLMEDWPAFRASTVGEVGSPDTNFRWFGHVGLALAATYAGRCSEGLAEAGRATAAVNKTGLSTAWSHDMAGRLRVACGENAAARDEFRQALADAQDTEFLPFALADWADYSAATGHGADADEAVRSLTALVEPVSKAPDERNLSYARGLVALGRKDPAAAIAALTAAQAALPARGIMGAEMPHTRVWLALADAYVAAGRWADAEPWARKVTESGPEHINDPINYVRSFFVLGQAREHQGDLAGAREAYRQFLKFWKDGTIDRAEVAQATRKVAGGLRP